MKTTRFLFVFISLVCLACLGSERASAGGARIIYVPLTVQTDLSVPEPLPLRADHTTTDARSIPTEWINAARSLVVHYANTSHGSQVLDGLRWLEQHDARFNVDIHEQGTVALPQDATALRVYNGNNYEGNTYITPDLYWENEDGINHTRSVANTGWFDISLWTWCGKMSYYGDEQIQDYIDRMADFAAEYPGMKFILYTGHTDGSAAPSSLWTHNNLVRQFAATSGQPLFDFADIESYDPDGNFYPTGSDACEWCDDWCSSHPTNFECQDLPSCAHTDGLQCTLKGQAFWYLMARLAGWDGR